METVDKSKDSSLAERVMREIMIKEDKQLFAAMLYNCYSLIKPDVAMELAWRKDMFEFVMPFFIQNIKDLTAQVDNVKKQTTEIKDKDKKVEEEKSRRPPERRSKSRQSRKEEEHRRRSPSVRSTRSGSVKSEPRTNTKLNSEHELESEAASRINNKSRKTKVSTSHSSIGRRIHRVTNVNV